MNLALCLNTGGRIDGESETFIAATLNSGGNSGGFRTEPGEHLVASTIGTRAGDSTNNDVKKGSPKNLVVTGPITTRSTPNGHVAAGVNSQEAFSGQLVPVAWSERTRQGDSILEIEPTDVMPALKTGSQRQQGVGVRRLLPVECEALQGLPREWTRYGHDGKEISDSARYRMVGNSVAVPVVQWIVERIMKASHSP